MRITKVLVFCLQQIPSVTVGVLNLLKTLQQENKLTYKFKQSAEVKGEDIAWADVIVVVRGCEEIERKIVEQAKKFSRYIYYFLDDDLLNIPKSSASAIYFEQPEIRDNMITMMQLSDCLWTTNPNIEAKYNQYFERSIVMNIPAEVIAGVYETKKEDVITIGFAGSIDHGKFVGHLLEDVIEKLLEQYKECITFEFFGCKPHFKNKREGITYIPYENNYESYRNKIISRNWDIALAPLQDSSFHRCKYFNKYIEYSGLGIPAIYSNVEPLNFIVKDHQNGLLVDNTKEAWEKAIIEMIDNAHLRMLIREMSIQDLCNNFNEKEIARILVEKSNTIIEYKAPSIKAKEIKLKNLYIQHLAYKLWDVIKEHRWKSPFIIGYKIIKKLKR